MEGVNGSANPVNWPATKIELRDIAALKPHPQNSRTHSAEQIKLICKAMRQWGWTMPVLIDEDDFILAGHARIRAAKKNGYTKAPCLVARGWSDAQKRAYIIADNRLTENGGWDKELLGMECAALEMNFDLDLLGFSTAQLDKLMGREEEDGSSKLGENKFSIVIECETEEEQTRLLTKFEEEGIECRALIS